MTQPTPVATLHGITFPGPTAGRDADDDVLWQCWGRYPGAGQPLWNELVARYDRGVAAVDAMAATWAAQERYVDAERFVVGACDVERQAVLVNRVA